MKKRTYIYRRFERFWHWTQALLIMFLTITGFEIHGTYNILGYENSVIFHDIAAWTLLILIAFSIFWHFSVGGWKQYVPTMKLVEAQLKYYITGIFTGAPHPTKKTSYNKFNPLQRLTYFGLTVIIIPIQVITGIVYMFPEIFPMLIGSGFFEIIHTMGSFLLVTFLIAHVYLLTTNEEPVASFEAMITGWEEVDIDPKEEHQKHMHKAVDKSIAGYYRLDKNGVFVDVNKAWLKMYKCFHRDNIIGKHMSSTRDADHITELTNIFNKVLSGETVIGIPVTRKCKDESVGRHILSMNPTYEGGEIVGVEGFIIDITSIENAQSQMYHTVRNSNAGYYRLNKNGYYTDVNDAWLEMYKCDNRDNIIGKHYSLSRTEGDLKRLDEIFKEVMEGATITSEIARRQCKDGSSGKHILSASPAYESTEIIGMEGFIITNLEEVELK
ncbi:MAG: cytochrome b/b6 domain-containing protein [Bacteroidales bacterium]|nr:cytochrome b/b6 domain-containing protein [Bacteroidales bacterium]